MAPEIQVHALSGTGSDNIFGLGVPPTILHNDGEGWTILSDDNTLTGSRQIWGSGPDDVFVAQATDSSGPSSDRIYHYDGQSWSQMPLGSDQPILLSIKALAAGKRSSTPTKKRVTSTTRMMVSSWPELSSAGW